MSPPTSELVSIVDDDPSIRASTASLVRSFGWEAHAFASAIAFLESDALCRTRCLICDVQMPVIDGIALLERLESAGFRLPTLFITAYASPRLLRLVQASSAMHLVEKPIDAAELEAWIVRALASHAGR